MINWIILYCRIALQTSNGMAHSKALIIWIRKGWLCSCCSTSCRTVQRKIRIVLAFWARLHTKGTSLEAVYVVRPSVDRRRTESRWLYGVESTLFFEVKVGFFDSVEQVFEFVFDSGDWLGYLIEDDVLVLLGDLYHFFRGFWMKGWVHSYCASKSRG